VPLKYVLSKKQLAVSAMDFKNNTKMIFMSSLKIFEAFQKHLFIKITFTLHI